MDGFENRKKFAVMERGQSYERAGQNVSEGGSEARCGRGSQGGGESQQRGAAEQCSATASAPAQHLR